MRKMRCRGSETTNCWFLSFALEIPRTCKAPDDCRKQTGKVRSEETSEGIDDLNSLQNCNFLTCCSVQIFFRSNLRNLFSDICERYGKSGKVIARGIPRTVGGLSISPELMRCFTIQLSQSGLGLSNNIFKNLKCSQDGSVPAARYIYGP